jgi:hypothetical protein
MTIAIVGRTGSGKTFSAKGMVEADLAAGERVCVVDPTGAWWGLRLKPDGETPAYPVVIFGGDHADVPIASDQGDKLGRWVADGDVRQCVVDVSGFSGAETTRFLTAFLESLYTKNRQTIRLVLDEADVMAPQNPMPEQRRLQGATNKIVRRGRIKGFKPVLITQRPAVLDKSVLSQIDTLIAMRLTSPHDRRAIEEWVKGNADGDEAKKVLGSLASLKRGEGWFWAPHDDVLERRQFPAICTFDSSRAPEPGESTRAVAPATLPDLDALRKAFGAVTSEIASSNEKAKTNEADAALRAEISKLGRDMLEAEARGFANGVSAAAERFRLALAEIDRMTTQAPTVIHLAPTIAPMTAQTAAALGPVIRAAGKQMAELSTAGPPRANVSPTARRILDVIHAVYPVSVSFKAAAMRAGASARSSAFNKFREEVERSGEIENKAGRLVSIDPERRSAAPALGDPVEAYASRLSPSWGAMLRVIAASTKPLTSADIALRSNVSPTSSGLSAGLRELVLMDLIAKQDGFYVLADEMREANK